jgi:hypothetical protein
MEGVNEPVNYTENRLILIYIAGFRLIIIILIVVCIVIRRYAKKAITSAGEGRNAPPCSSVLLSLPKTSSLKAAYFVGSMSGCPLPSFFVVSMVRREVFLYVPELSTSIGVVVNSQEKVIASGESLMVA